VVADDPVTFGRDDVDSELTDDVILADAYEGEDDGGLAAEEAALRIEEER
jgi:hypothetical protein